MESHSPQEIENLIQRLNQKEGLVLGLLAKGYSDQQIANSLFIGLNAVQGILEPLRDKTFTHNRQELVDFAVKNVFGTDEGVY